MIIFLILLNVVFLSSLILLIWYIRELLKKADFMYQDVTEVYDLLKDFLLHLEKVYELPVFHGDDTLEQLLKHAKDVVQKIKERKKTYDIVEEIEEEQEGDDDSLV